ncbi:MAG: hypothetical protein NTU73_13640, partial [Ignavibacteriae bacterium]|nr:hypothetical protein [Ignavibacteriota bacterium]
NLLINGCAGIAVGMATNIPPHNLGEVVDGAVMLIDDPETTVEKLMTVIKGPDFPTGGYILGRDGIKDAYTTGRGSIVIQAKTRIETDKKGKVEKVEKPKKDLDIVINEGEHEADDAISLIFLFCLMILFFKLSRIEIVQLFTIAFGIPIITELLIYNNFSVWDKIISLFIALSFFIIAYSAETKRKKKFVALLATYSKRHLETHRMKKELSYAREIQLSMLPPCEAIFGDLEIAGTSVPTYEVGGDYFDYFKISENLIGIFICDVSGHGVASALLLSGLRSCMHLILEETNNP